MTVEEGYVPVCDLAVNTGPDIAVPEIMFATDGANGTYIKRLRVGSLVFSFADTYMFRVGMWGPAGYVQLDDEQWEPTIETDTISGVITITQALGDIDDDYDGITLSATMTPVAEGYQVSAITMDNENVDFSVEWFEIPRLGVRSQTEQGNMYLAHGFVGGMVLKDPENVTLDDALRTTITGPPSMQFMSYYDITTREHLYLSTDDDDGAPKNYVLTGDGSTSVCAFMHWCPNPRRAGNPGVVPYTMTYNVSMELFKGRTQDGRCGYYDAAIRYRSWATDMTRPWMIEAAGPWMDAGDVSSRVKNSDFYYISGHSNSSAPANFWSDIVTDMTRVQTILNADEMLGMLYGWAENIAFLTDLEPPAFTPLIQGADQNTALGVASAAGIHLSYYTLPPFWESTLAGDAPFDYNDFVGTIDYNDILQYTIRDNDDSPTDPIDPLDPILGGGSIGGPGPGELPGGIQ